VRKHGIGLVETSDGIEKTLKNVTKIIINKPVWSGQKKRKIRVFPFFGLSDWSLNSSVSKLEMIVQHRGSVKLR
jgi:hypothetical protein